MNRDKSQPKYALEMQSIEYSVKRQSGEKDYMVI